MHGPWTCNWLLGQQEIDRRRKGEIGVDKVDWSKQVDAVSKRGSFYKNIESFKITRSKMKYKLSSMSIKKVEKEIIPIWKSKKRARTNYILSRVENPFS